MSQTDNKSGQGPCSKQMWCAIVFCGCVILAAVGCAVYCFASSLSKKEEQDAGDPDGSGDENSADVTKNGKL